MIKLHGREYRIPQSKTVVICLDGSDPRYVDDAIDCGAAPTLARWRSEGFYKVGEAWMPTFTNPNNLSIVTGAPPRVHGISGNFYLDESTGEARPLSRASDVRGETVLTKLVERGVEVAVVTAKKKLLAMLDPGKNAFSAENAVKEATDLVGRPAPDVYSADCSLFVLDLTVALLDRVTLVYASTTDYVQHKHDVGSSGARDFYQAIDARLAKLDALGARVVLTADHGMNAKTKSDGTPRVTYLEPLVGPQARVILPITDPYVVHHGALGGAAMVYLNGADARAVTAALEAADGVEAVLDRATAASKFELPIDRIGDLMVLGTKGAVLGRSAEAHDLSAVGLGLRSHGALHERHVPIISNRPAPAWAKARALRNSDAFAIALDQ